MFDKWSWELITKRYLSVDVWNLGSGGYVQKQHHHLVPIKSKVLLIYINALPKGIDFLFNDCGNFLQYGKLLEWSSL
jgi:hypothetical protein